MRRFALILAVALALSAAVTMTASAHNCNSGTAGECGPCTEGETHNHNDPEHSCQSGGLPGFTTPLMIGAVGVALALVAARRS